MSGSTINAGAYAGFGNNQMLCADPATGETRRFLVGPNVCEITGVFVTPDEKTMFVGIQHPGEAPSGRQRPGQPEAVQLLARRRRRRPAALVLRRHHQGRRRPDRQLTTPQEQSRPGRCVRPGRSLGPSRNGHVPIGTSIRGVMGRKAQL